MVMTDLDKLRALLERAAHAETPVEEARTSAVIAAKMIVQNKVELRLPTNGATDANGLDFLRNEIDEIFDKWWRPDSPRKQSRRKRKTGRGKNPPRHERRIVYAARCPNWLDFRDYKCECCGEKIEAESEVHWVAGRFLTPDTAITHRECRAHWAHSTCLKCGKVTDERPPPRGPTISIAKNTGHCACCGGFFVPGTSVCRLDFLVTHLLCGEHLTKKPCPNCNWGTK